MARMHATELQQFEYKNRVILGIVMTGNAEEDTEVTLDYGILKERKVTRLPCHCGEPNCRGRIDWK